jgi:hypothetical protein
MACEIMACCQFFKDNMGNFPKTAEYIKNKLCSGDYEKCSRYRIYKEYGNKDLPPDFLPEDAVELEKVMQCLKKNSCKVADQQQKETVLDSFRTPS